MQMIVDSVGAAAVKGGRKKLTFTFPIEPTPENRALREMLDEQVGNVIDVEITVLSTQGRLDVASGPLADPPGPKPPASSRSLRAANGDIIQPHKFRPGAENALKCSLCEKGEFHKIHKDAEEEVAADPAAGPPNEGDEPLSPTAQALVDTARVDQESERHPPANAEELADRQQAESNLAAAHA